MEQQVRDLTQIWGKDEIDDGIDGLCEHQLKRLWFSDISDCEWCDCYSKYPTASSWYASLIYFTNAVIPSWLGTGLEEILTGEESLQELEDLIEGEIPDDMFEYRCERLENSQ